MGRFSGRGGSLYALGERFAFSDLPLENCGDGWDWRAPLRLSCWTELREVYVVIAGERNTIDPIEVFLPAGKVCLPRNMSHGQVFASGECLPTSSLVENADWEVHVMSSMGDQELLGQNMGQLRVLGMTGKVFGAQVPITQVLARFPSGNGMLVGVGEASESGSDTAIEFNREGVKYVVW